MDLSDISRKQLALLNGASKCENPDIDALLFDLNDVGRKMTKDQAIHLLKQAKLQGKEFQKFTFLLN